MQLSEMLPQQLESITAIRMHLFSNREISKQLREMPALEVFGKNVECQIWDLNRMEALALSSLGAEEFEIDFTRFDKDGLPCLLANDTSDYEGYLVVIDGDTLAGIYDKYGSKILEGNVRAYLSARGKVNKGIQNTIRLSLIHI